MSLGYNRKDEFFKHYRYCIDRELERTNFIDESPFSEIPIYRGSRVIEDSFLNKIFGKKESDYRVFND